MNPKNMLRGGKESTYNGVTSEAAYKAYAYNRQKLSAKSLRLIYHEQAYEFEARYQKELKDEQLLP